jgi:uncharacterized protein (DUF1330 family)
MSHFNRWQAPLMLASALAIGAAGGAAFAQSKVPVYSVFEAHVKDEAAYAKALPEVQKLIKDQGGEYIAGGFNKTKMQSGTPAGNRYVVIKWEDMAAFDKAFNNGIKAWVDKNAPDARQLVVEGK